MGNYFAILVAIFTSMFIAHEYKTSAVYTPVEHGYSAEYRARLEGIIAGVEPLHVADLGEMQ